MRHTRLWNGMASLVSFFLVFAVVGTNCMMDYAGTVNTALGISTSKVVNEAGAGEDTIYFESEYGELNSENLQKLIADTYAQSVAEESEGAVLLKNENNALPLDSSETRVTLFGHAVVQPLYKAASAGSKGYQGEYGIDLRTALTDAGFSINDTLYQAYAKSPTVRGTGAFDFASQTTSELSMGEEDISFYTDALKASWSDDYNDAAIVMLAREGGEGMELAMEDSFEGISQLALHQQEKDLLAMIRDSKKFKKVIVLINAGNPMELEWLDEYDVDACLWIGQPGQRGFEGVADILTGTANPSGRLTDTYASNSLSAPSLVNGSANNQQWSNLEEMLKSSPDGEDNTSWYSVQAEGIYIGYKYYETRYEDVILNQGKAASTAGSSDGEPWNYSNEVTYPFGYGLSYTNFEQTLESVTVDEDEINVQVTVKNTGEVPGKSVVQVYAQTPYGEYEKKNLVEKSAIQLLDFGKTAMLNPGESETVTITCDKYLLSSYDYVGAKGYILSGGEYYIAVGENAHDALNNILAAKGAVGMTDEAGNEVSPSSGKTFRWSESFDDKTYAVSKYTGEEVTNRFDDCDINYWVEDAVTYLSRSNWEGTYPTAPVKAAASEEMIEVLGGEYYVKPEDSPSVSDFVLGENQGIPLAAMIGLTYDDPAWETYLNQFTLDELASLLKDNMGSVEVPTVGKPAIAVGDGPDGIGDSFDAKKYGDGRADCAFPSQIVLASTFNKALMVRRGELMGEECLYLGKASQCMPGGNLHRTPFGGRNFEYYSEDAVFTYLCMIPEVTGIESKGVHACPKHLAGNDQENNRKGISCFFNEQAFREGALKGFEGSMAGAGGKSVMHGFNRLGMKWCSASEALCTSVAAGEWGFTGWQVTDAVANGKDPYTQHFTTTLAVGTDSYCIDFQGKSSAAIKKQITDHDDGTMLQMLRNSVHDYLYTIANNAVMNGYSKNSKVVSVTPWWKTAGYSAVGGFALLELLCLVMMLKKRRKNSGIEVEVEQ